MKRRDFITLLGGEPLQEGGALSGYPGAIMNEAAAVTRAMLDQSGARARPRRARISRLDAPAATGIIEG